MLPPKNGKPITFKPTPQLREQTEAIADSQGISLSDYVRKAVEHYNTHHQQPYPEFNAKMAAITERINQQDSKSDSEKEYIPDALLKHITRSPTASKGYIEKHSKPVMVQPIPKGGK